MKDKQTSLGFFDASVLVGTCREEAKKKIYRIVCENHFFGFGAEIEAEISNKLKGMPGVLAVLPDCLINKCRQVQSIARFSPTNRNYHLNDVFSYYHLSERNLETISDNCCVVIRKPNGKFGTEEQTVDFCTQMLTKVLGRGTENRNDSAVDSLEAGQENFEKPKKKKKKERTKEGKSGGDRDDSINDDQKEDDAQTKEGNTDLIKRVPVYHEADDKASNNNAYVHYIGKLKKNDKIFNSNVWDKLLRGGMLVLMVLILVDYLNKLVMRIGDKSSDNSTINGVCIYPTF
ncbi:hypothetical protein IFM89_024499 [Coptis chinensis]|uniref:MORF/ORRM1/DAG-like MORF domain-containing protein n=1 Tax=Coptis chinensis TaxID=261450 RepID=A0A835H8I4_9MAGN|nr:hypothetical protein IFM89_024499 [Coptis chinensis]